MAINGGYRGRLAAASIILSADFTADLSGAPLANDSVETAIEKLLGMINFGEEVSFTSTASAAGSTVLTVNSSARQELTGVTTQNYVLPDATTLSVGQTFVFINKSTGVATIQYDDTSTLITAASNTYTIAICTAIGTSNGTWTVVQLPALSSGVLANSFTTATAANTASAIITRDASKNFATNNVALGYTSTATAAGTTTLTVTSSKIQEFTGSTTQTCVLPDATTLIVNTEFHIVNNSTGLVTVQYDDTSAFTTVPFNHKLIARVSNIGTSNGTWAYELIPLIISGSFTPSPTSLTVVGTPTYTGAYTLIGDVLKGTIRAQSDTTTASTEGSTYFTGMPYNAAAPDTCTAADTNSVASYGVGLVSSDKMYTPTWGATASVIVSFTYKI